MTLKNENGFCKCSLPVLSANGWKDQNMASLFSRQIWIWYGEGIVRLANRVTVWRQSKVTVDFTKVLGHEVFSSERSLNQSKSTRVCIRSITNRIALFPFVCCFCFVRAFSFQGHTKIAETKWTRQSWHSPFNSAAKWLEAKQSDSYTLKRVHITVKVSAPSVSNTRREFTSISSLNSWSPQMCWSK